MSGRVQYIVEDYGSCAWYRCFTPGKALEARGYSVGLDDHLDARMIDSADVIVFQRLHLEELPRAIDYCRSAGKLTVYEIDDDFWNIHSSNPAYEHYRRPEVLATIEEAIRRVDRVTTTTAHLRERLKTLNKRTYVLPNMLPDDHWRFDCAKAQTRDRVVIGWAGSNTHAHDLKQLEGVIEQVLARYEHVEFAWAGMGEMPFSSPGRMRLLENVPIDRYAELIAQFDIGLAPVTDDVFNRAKSDLKVLEYAMVGIPVVASSTPTYTSSIRQAETGFLARNPKDWLKYLCRLVEDADLRERIGGEAQRWARTRLISANVGLWERAYALETVQPTAEEASA